MHLTIKNILSYRQLQSVERFTTSVISDISSEIITCPENCVIKIVQFINSAESEILLSQQTLMLIGVMVGVMKIQ